GSYNINADNPSVTINKGIIIQGFNASGPFPTAAIFNLTNNAILGIGTGNITAPVVNVAVGSKIQDGMLLADATGIGVVNVASGTFNENVIVNKDITLNGANSGVDPRAYAGPAVRNPETIVNGG